MRREGTFTLLCVVLQLSRQHFPLSPSDYDVQENPDGFDSPTAMFSNVVNGNNGSGLELLHNASQSPDAPLVGIITARVTETGNNPQTSLTGKTTTLSDSGSSTTPTAQRFEWDIKSLTTLSSSVEYLWNRQSQSAENFHQGFCSTCAEPDNRQKSDLECSALQCFPCDCNNLCPLGTCCTDMLPKPKGDHGKATGCTENNFYAVVRCPDGWTDVMTRQACEEGAGLYTADEPVTDLATHVTYRNKACAICHNVTVHTAWNLSVTCAHYQYMYTAQSREEFLQRAKDDTVSQCSLKLTPPSETKPRECPHDSHVWFSHSVGKCNVSGQWEACDEEVEENCHTFTDLPYRMYDRDSGRLFTNLFCAMCNGVEPRRTLCSSEVSDRSYDSSIFLGANVAPLSLLFSVQERFEETERAEYEQCSDGWLAPDNECQNLTCTAGKTLENNMCNTAVADIRGLVYSVNMTFVLSPPLAANTHDNTILTVVKTQAERWIVESLEKHARRADLTLYIDTLALPTTSDTPDDVTVGQIRVVGDVTASRNISRDEAELSIITRLFFMSWNMTVNGNTSVVEQRNVDYTTGMPSNVTYRMYIQYKERDSSVYYDPRFPPDLKIKLSPMLVCPYIEFNQSQYEIEMAGESETGVKLILIFGDVEAEVEDLHQTWLEGGELYVCNDALNSLQRPEKQGELGQLSWQYVLTMVVMPLSMVCLALTLIVYSLLPALRTQPGLNTMGTCCALLLAQGALLLASHRVTSGAWCKALGVLVHASWLSVFCWTSVCSLHMFRAFSANTFRGSASGRRFTLARNIALTTLAPAAVVGVVMGVSFATSDGISIGYSGSSCYLAGPLLVGVSTVLPVSLLLLLNLLLFVLTVRRIRQVTKLNAHAESERDSQQHVYVCARLSLLTGATWIISLVAEGLGVDWLQVASILTNGGQGLLLFLSYVTTRRVASMLAVRLGCKVKSASTHTTSSTARTAFSSEVTSDRNRPKELEKF